MRVTHTHPDQKCSDMSETRELNMDIMQAYVIALERIKSNWVPAESDQRMEGLAVKCIHDSPMSETISVSFGTGIFWLMLNQKISKAHKSQVV